MTRLGFIVLVAALVAAVAAGAEGDAKLKPGARGKLCLSCHVDFEETLRQPSVHTPVKAGDCADCHNPHASRHGKLLADEPDRICSSCHDGIVPTGARSVHAVVAEGRCSGCHDAHASPHRGNLSVEGNALCATCHADVAGAAAAARFKHAPVQSGCLTCHDPHASKDEAALLVRRVPELCLDCHKAEAPSFARQHLGYPVASSDCTSCHDPHGSSTGGLLWANVHAPVANGMCGQCHGEASGPRALEVKRDGIDLCRGCHDNLVDAAFATSHVHGPLADRRACLSCHDPHASPEAGLLAEREGRLCGSCHADVVARQARSLAKHPPAESGECTACHVPHGSDAPWLLVRADVNDACGTCHEWQRHSSHPIGPAVADPRNPSLTLDCTSCHGTHGTAFKALLHLDPKADLCVQCHTQFQR